MATRKTSARSFALPEKSAVCDALLASLRRAHAAMVHAAEQTRQGATHEENRSEGDKDMRATEQSYVARGQAMRVEGLADELQRFEAMQITEWTAERPIAPGALVHVRIDDEDDRAFFVAAQGAGTELIVDGVTVTVITPASPVGKALFGRREGDGFELAIRGAMREWSIESVL